MRNSPVQSGAPWRAGAAVAPSDGGDGLAIQRARPLGLGWVGLTPLACIEELRGVGAPTGCPAWGMYLHGVSSRVAGAGEGRACVAVGCGGGLKPKPTLPWFSGPLSIFSPGTMNTYPGNASSYPVKTVFVTCKTNSDPVRFPLNGLFGVRNCFYRVRIALFQCVP